MSHGGSNRAILAAFSANLGIAVAKFVGFLITRSSSMLAESIHSLADTTNQALLLVGAKRAARPEDEHHQFGYGAERFFWSFVVALVLFAGGAVFAIYEGVEKIRHPHELESVTWAIGILVFAIALEAFSFRTALVEANRIRFGASWPGFIRNSRNPELPVLLLEDSGALIGLVLALAAVVTAHVTEEPVWDGIGTLSIGVLLALIAFVLAVEMKSLLIGESASRRDAEAIRNAVAAAPDVSRLIHLRTRHLGPEEILVAMKIEFDHGLDFAQISDAIDTVESRVRAVVPAASRIYIEPDRYREPAQ